MNCALTVVAVLRPTTVAGFVLAIVVPSPIWPEALKPQHLTWPSESAAQEWDWPPEIVVAFEIPNTETGAARFVAVPSPSCPTPLEPQHLTAPDGSAAHVWTEPAETIASGIAVPAPSRMAFGVPSAEKVLVTPRAAFLGATTEGVNVTATVQLPPTDNA